MKKRTTANLTLVREFYTNSATTGTLGISWRNQDFTISYADIRNFYKLPEVENCQFQCLRVNQNLVHWEDAFDVMGVEGVGWTTRGGKQFFERKYMNEEAKIWLNFMKYNVRPLAHISDVTVEGALLLYLLMTAQPVDIAVIARDQMLHCLNSKRALLVFPHLITDLCRARRIIERMKDMTLPPVTTRVFTAPQLSSEAAESSRSRKKGKRPTVEELEEESEGGERSITLESLSEQIVILNDQVISLNQQVMANEFRRQQFMDPMMLQVARSLQVNFPPGFEEAFWQNSIPSTTYFHQGLGQSLGAAEAEDEAGGAGPAEGAGGEE